MEMNKVLLFCSLGLFSVFAFSGCLKDTPNQTEVDNNVILQYIEDNNLNTTEHASGIHYVLEEPGVGENPAPDAKVEVKYKGYLTSGFVFDETPENETRTFELQGLIVGWQIAIPLLKPGGKGTFIIPSGLAYGPSGRGPIPPNSVLVFEMELVSIK